MRFLSVFAAVFVWAAPSIAAEQPEYLLAYKAYADAMEAGDLATAIEKSEQAWQLAEEADGVNAETLTVLVQNFVTLGLSKPSQDLLTATERAEELIAEGYGNGDFHPTEMALARQYTIAQLDDKAPSTPLLNAVRNAEHAGVPNRSDLMIRARFLLVAMLVNQKKSNDAITEATKLYHAVEQTPGIAKELFARAAILRASALSSDIDYRRADRNGFGVADSYVERLKQASVILGHAVGQFEPATTVDQISPYAIEAFTWRMIVSGLLASARGELEPDYEFEGKKKVEKLDRLLRKTVSNCTDETCDCEVNWVKRQPPHYPPAALMSGYVGAAYLAYDINAKGKVENARVLKELPEKRFGEYALNATKGWRADVETTPKECLGEQVVSIRFAFGN